LGEGFGAVYLASHRHSGSTLLDLLVSGHSQVVSIGEAQRFQRGPDTACNCGAPSWRECAFWREVERQLLAESGIRLESARVDSDDLAEFTDVNRALFSAVQRVSGKRWVLDSSKELPRLRRFLASGIELQVIHLRRDARGVVHSNLRKGRELARECRQYVRDHVGAAHALRDRPHVDVEYEHLVRDPARELARVMAALGLQLEPAQLESWKSRERHNVGGNRMRFTPDEAIRADESWRLSLSPWRQLSIQLRTLPARLRSGRGLELAHRWCSRRS
jgi:hypothetical protein